MRAHGPARIPARGPLLARDRAILLHLARLRVLTLAQLGALVFPGLHRSRVSRRVGALARSGFVTTWEDRSVIGGRPRYVIPSEGALRWALRQLTEGAAPFAHAQLLASMLGSDARKPLTLRPGSSPGFLPHLREVNDVLTAIQTARELRVTFVSSWHRPLPNRAGGLALPQPDGVLVRTGADEKAQLVFLEHDRGTESRAHFARAKADRFRALADHPDVLRELTGFDGLTVWVTVSCPDADARIASLRSLVRERLAAPLFRFVRADKLIAGPAAALAEVGAWDGVSPAAPVPEPPVEVQPEIRHLDTVLPPPGWTGRAVH